jgi:hypothetical protein
MDCQVSWALFKLTRFTTRFLPCPAQAEQDCDIALSYEPAYLKALTRRSVAHMELGKHEAALEVRI